MQANSTSQAVASGNAGMPNGQTTA
jgi:hypothetical protein